MVSFLVTCEVAGEVVFSELKSAHSGWLSKGVVFSDARMGVNLDRLRVLYRELTKRKCKIERNFIGAPAGIRTVTQALRIFWALMKLDQERCNGI